MRSPHERSYQFGVCISTAASRRTTSIRSSSVTRVVPRRFAALALSGAVAPPAARLRCFIGSSGRFVCAFAPKGLGFAARAPAPRLPHAPAPHRMNRRVISLYCASSRGTPSPMSSAASSWCRCRRSGAALYGGFCGGTPQSLHIYHVLRSDTSFMRFRGFLVASRGA